MSLASKCVAFVALALCCIVYAAPAQMNVYAGAVCSGNPVSPALASGTCTNVVVGGYGLFIFGTNGVSTVQTFSDSKCTTAISPYMTPYTVTNFMCNNVTLSGLQLSLNITGPTPNAPSSAASLHGPVGLILAAGMVLAALF
eukprot:TRINITY_DN3768_c0_g1_i2.p1 TRINITY_DN3768_c0_g1~~TRINITY_DN3768_c0_g1_i2.p1  ORF type:complete len:142 (-),score=25.58 TRINITY_DN3768_c0_g1_i2:137-562(-)